MASEGGDISVVQKLSVYKQRKKEKEKIRQEMFAFARQQCDAQLKDMFACFKENKLLSAINCRKEAKERDECLFKFTTDEHLKHFELLHDMRNREGKNSSSH